VWSEILLILLAVLAVGVVAVLPVGERRWRGATAELHARLEAGRLSPVTSMYDSGELDGLPEPVRNYLRAVLQEGQPVVSAVTIKHSGAFNMSEGGEDWKPFASSQRVVVGRPGFVWDARMRMAPGVSAYVHDAYVAGEGVLEARLLGLFTVMAEPRTPELARGELMRFLAESAWYPTLLLPGQGVRWDPVDNSRARATLTDGTTTVSLVVSFDERNLIESAYSDARPRVVGGAHVATPWQGHFWDYARRDGMLVPLQGEVAWLLPEGTKPYWRAQATHVSYDFSR